MSIAYLTKFECDYIIQTTNGLPWREASNYGNNRVYICDGIDRDTRFNDLVNKIMPAHSSIEKARVHFMHPEDKMDSHIDTVFDDTETIIVRLNAGDPRFTIENKNVNEQVGIPIHVPHHIMHGIVTGKNPRYSLAIWYIP